MEQEKYFVIDFDSTFTKVEALDKLAEIALNDHPEKEARVQRIKELTDLGMEGKLSVQESLKQRLQLLEADKAHLNELIQILKEEVSESFKRNKSFLHKHAEQIFIISNGFHDFIEPVVADYGIQPDHVFANRFTYNKDGKINGYDPDSLLADNQGKVSQLRNLELNGDIFVIGDGYTDYEIKEAGLANAFYAFTENVSRSQITDKADRITPNLDEILFMHKLERAYSYPKHRICVLLLENIHPDAAKALQAEGYNVETLSGSLDEDELCERIKHVSVLGIRSKTQLTERVLSHAKRLMAVGAFCIGTNQIDLEAAARRGIAVFNAPFSNTRSVVELALAEIILLMRNIPDKSVSMHQGKWEKSASGSNEIRGKKLGIVGYGNIGAQLSVLAEAIGMQVYFYDVVEKLALGNATKCSSLDELLEQSDIVSLHVDGRAENKNLIGQAEFERMKEGVIFLNLARGHVVEVDALKAAMKSGKVRGAAVDVFPEEPKANNEPFSSSLTGLPNLLLTPHIGGSTAEAQENIGQFVSAKLSEYINTGSTTNSVNFPELQLPRLQNAHRLIHVHLNTPGILASINQCLASHSINISGQYLKTNETIGYVITDIDKQYDEDVIQDLKSIPNTIRFRVLY